MASGADGRERVLVGVLRLLQGADPRVDRRGATARADFRGKLRRAWQSGE